jgi:predicted nicotinamide N-methyase
MDQEDDFDNGADLAALFFNSNYVEQTVDLPSGRSMPYLALKTARTDPDLTGQILWPGCTLLLHWLDRNVDLFQDKRSVELGAGTGICSLFVARYGQPLSILATDGSSPVIELVTRNVNFHKLSESVSCCEMKWTSEDVSSVIAKFGQFDFVIGSEIAYDESCIQSLVDSVKSLLNDTGRFVIGHIDRYAQTTRLLYRQLEDAGFVKEAESLWDELVDFRMELIVGSVMVWKKS